MLQVEDVEEAQLLLFLLIARKSVTMIKYFLILNNLLC